VRTVNTELSLLESSAGQLISSDRQISETLQLDGDTMSSPSSFNHGIDEAESVAQSSCNTNNPSPLLSGRSPMHTACDRSVCTEEVTANHTDSALCDDAANSYLDDSLDVCTEVPTLVPVVMPLSSLLTAEPAQEMARTFLSTSARGEKSGNESVFIIKSSSVASPTSNPRASLANFAQAADPFQPSHPILDQIDEELPKAYVAEVKTCSPSATQEANDTDTVTRSVNGPTTPIHASSEEGLNEKVFNTSLPMPPPSRPVTLRDLIFGGATFTAIQDTRRREPAAETAACLPSAPNMPSSSSVSAIGQFPVLGSEDGTEERMIDFSTVKATNFQQPSAAASAIGEDRDNLKTERKPHKKRKSELGLLEDFDKTKKQKKQNEGEEIKENTTSPEGSRNRHSKSVKRDWSALTSSLPIKREERDVRSSEKSIAAASLSDAAGVLKPFDVMAIGDPDDGRSSTPIPLMVLAAYRVTLQVCTIFVLCSQL
jgi:hypothetical protein